MPSKPSPERDSPGGASPSPERATCHGNDVTLSVQNPLVHGEGPRPRKGFPAQDGEIEAQAPHPLQPSHTQQPHQPPQKAPQHQNQGHQGNVQGDGVMGVAMAAGISSTASSASLGISASAEDIVSPRSERQWRLDWSQFEAARKDPESIGDSRRHWLLNASGRSDPVAGYYRRQNEMIDNFSEMEALSESLLPPSRPDATEAERLARGERRAILLSNLANVVLLLAKIAASVTSRSLAIIASTLDSVLDLLSGFILWYTDRSMRRQNPYKYPIGKKRMQPLGIIVFACIMAMLGLQILVEAIRQLTETEHNAGLGDAWQVYVSIMVFAIAVKAALYLYCRTFSNEIVLAYAQDHFFDVVTNVIGLIAAVLAGAFAWWIDPLGAILLSLYTMANWSRTVYENVRSLTGQSAPPSFLQKLTYLCWNHHEAILMIDTVRAYTFGASYFTEVDVVLPSDMPLQEAHDIGESLQNKLETIPEIERAFVHLDYEVSHRPEHHHMHAHFQAPPGGPSVGTPPRGGEDPVSP